MPRSPAGTRAGKYARLAFVLCRSDTGDGGWSIHAPGATDEQIATGEAPALVSGAAQWTGSRWDAPTPRDYRAAFHAMTEER